MAYLPGFDNDIFISYTHKDNHGPGARVRILKALFLQERRYD